MNFEFEDVDEDLQLLVSRITTNQSINKSQSDTSFEVSLSRNAMNQKPEKFVTPESRRKLDPTRKSRLEMSSELSSNNSEERFAWSDITMRNANRASTAIQLKELRSKSCRPVGITKHGITDRGQLKLRRQLFPCDFKDSQSQGRSSDTRSLMDFADETPRSYRRRSLRIGGQKMRSTTKNDHNRGYLWESEGDNSNALSMASQDFNNLRLIFGSKLGRCFPDETMAQSQVEQVTCSSPKLNRPSKIAAGCSKTKLTLQPLHTSTQESEAVELDENSCVTRERASREDENDHEFEYVNVCEVECQTSPITHNTRSVGNLRLMSEQLRFVNSPQKACPSKSGQRTFDPVVVLNRIQVRGTPQTSTEGLKSSCVVSFADETPVKRWKRPSSESTNQRRKSLHIISPGFEELRRKMEIDLRSCFLDETQPNDCFAAKDSTRQVGTWTRKNIAGCKDGSGRGRQTAFRPQLTSTQVDRAKEVFGREVSEEGCSSDSEFEVELVSVACQTSTISTASKALEYSGKEGKQRNGQLIAEDCQPSSSKLLSKRLDSSPRNTSRRKMKFTFKKVPSTQENSSLMDNTARSDLNEIFKFTEEQLNEMTDGDYYRCFCLPYLEYRYCTCRLSE